MADRKGAIASEEDVLKIYKMLDPRPKELLLSRRRFVKGGPIQTYNTKERRRKPRAIFLFNDVLLIVKKEGRTKYWLKTYVKLRDEIRLEDMQTKLVPNVEFRLVAPKRTLIFFAENEAKKKEWLRVIQGALDGKYDPDKEVVEKHTHSVERVEVQVPAEPSEPVVEKVVDTVVQKEVVTKEVFQFGPGVDVDGDDLDLDSVDLDDALLDALEDISVNE